jgi:uncharacterized GH25 family protein
MKQFITISVTLALVAGLLTPVPGFAHGIWFAQRSSELALIYGVGADDLDIIKRQLLVTDIAAYDAEQRPVATSLRATERLLLVNVDNHPAIVAAVLDNGTWSKTPEGEWLKKGRDEVPNATVSERNYKYAVHLRSPLAGPLGPLPKQVLQIVPEDEVLPDQMGSPLKLRVLYQGKPVGGARVLTDFVNDPDAQPIKTAEDGSVTINIRNQGLNVVTAIFDAPPEDPAKSDKVEHLATLSFVLPHAPE